MNKKITFSNELVNFIEETSQLSKVSSILLFALRSQFNSDDTFTHNIFKYEGDFIDIPKGSYETISYVPKTKLELCSGFEDSKFRTTIKIGRFINKFLKKEVLVQNWVTDGDVEQFVNVYKSYFSTDSNNFKIVEGEEILKWYLEDNYLCPNGTRFGTLWNSCMRYESKNSFMEIYSTNPNKVRMLINLDESGKLKTRALLWEDVEDSKGNKYKIMDRIYSFYDHEVDTFKKWAFNNGYIHKFEQSAKSERTFRTPDGPKNLNLKIKLDTWKVRKYPYVDTFKFLNWSEGILTNSRNFFYDFELVQNDGALEGPPNPEEDN